MTGQALTRDVAANVLWHFGQGGYPSGAFTATLLEAWGKADPTNSALLGRAFPGLGHALELANLPGGIDRLKEIASA